MGFAALYPSCDIPGGSVPIALDGDSIAKPIDRRTSPIRATQHRLQQHVRTGRHVFR
jgi:hypothetical protein